MSLDSAQPTMARRLGRRGAAIHALLATALGCNVAALLIPFLEVDVFLKGRHVYSLPRSVKLMWEADLHLLAALILLFSILFPLGKLGVLLHVWLVEQAAEHRRRLLRLIEPLGKWSFMDIFVVTIILVLANDQFFVGAQTRAGVYFFIAAIALSMVTALFIERLDAAPGPGETGPPRSMMSVPGAGRWVTLSALVLAVPALGAAVGQPFIKVTQFLMKGHAYSVAASAAALWKEGAFLISAVVAVTLVAMPVVCLGALFSLWLVPLDPARRRRALGLLSAMWQWSMLDVFGLSLLVFLTEGDALVKTEVKPGLYLIVAAIAVLSVTYLLVTRASRTD